MAIQPPKYRMTRTEEYGSPRVRREDFGLWRSDKPHPRTGAPTWQKVGAVSTRTVPQSQDRYEYPGEYGTDHSDFYEAGGQGRLFGRGDVVRPAETQVTFLSTHSSASHMAPALLGTMYNRSLAEGRAMTHDDSLSKHSERWVEKLSERGVVEMREYNRNAISKASSDVDWEDEPRQQWPYGDPVPDEEFDAGRRTARAILRSTRPRKQHFDMGVQGELF